MMRRVVTNYESSRAHPRSLDRILFLIYCSLSLFFHGSKDLRSEDAPTEKKKLIRITVVVVLATQENNVIDKRLVALAKSVQKKYSELLGFQVEKILQHSIPLEGTHTFQLLDKQTLKVTITKPHDPKTDRIGIKVQAPGIKELSYSCSCHKFFPIVTAHRTQDKSTLILAIMAKPCTGVGP